MAITRGRKFLPGDRIRINDNCTRSSWRGAYGTVLEREEDDEWNYVRFAPEGIDRDLLIFYEDKVDLVLPEEK